jgi:hypothetical protein
LANKAVVHILRSETGTATLEMALIAFLLFAITFSVAEFGYIWFQWNSAEKATQIGVRQVVTSDPLAVELATFSCGNANVLPGTPCSAAGTTSFGTITCSGASRTCTGGYAFDGPEFDRLLARMQQVYADISAANLTVEYRDIGLGFAGRPRPVPLISVRLVNMTYAFLTIDWLMGESVSMPEFRATLTGEDIRTAGAS